MYWLVVELCYGWVGCGWILESLDDVGIFWFLVLGLIVNIYVGFVSYGVGN